MRGAAKEWRTASCDPAAAERLAGELRLPQPAAALLVSRGIADGESAERFLNPRLSHLSDAYALPDVERGAIRLWEAIDRKEAIAVYGDYDVDGITATALMVRTLKALGACVQPFLPLRLDEGYGLTLDGLQRCIETHRPRLIVTVDCGTGSVAAVRKAAESGVEIIVTDHHEPPAAIAPALAVVNPKRAKDSSLHMLAGVGVAFKLCHAMLKHRRTASSDVDLKRRLDLVALGTIADIVPLSGENRILARHGLDALNRTDLIGLRALTEVAGIKGRIDTYEVGFRLGPRLNAAGRLGDAQRALQLLLTESDEEAAKLAAELDASNRERQEVEKRMVREAIEQVERTFDPARDFGITVAAEGWHPGVVGIVASRICQRFHRPVVCIALNGASGRGSCRSIEGFDMVAGLDGCADLLVKHGGHAMAAGLEIETVRWQELRERFNETVRRAMGSSIPPAPQRVDAWLALAEVDDALAGAMDRLRPFGMGNPTPIWASRAVRLVGQPRIVGQGHLKMLLAGGGVQREAIAWNMGEREMPDGPIDVAFQLKRETYLGREKIVLEVQDFRSALRESA